MASVTTSHSTVPSLTTAADSDAMHHQPQLVTNGEYVKKVVNKTVQDIIQDAPYSHISTNDWTNKIVETLVRTLVATDRDNKYIVSCMVVQNLNQGMRSATSCFWNAQTDTGYSFINERNGMYVITTIFVCKA